MLNTILVFIRYIIFEGFEGLEASIVLFVQLLLSKCIGPSKYHVDSFIQ